MKNGEGRAQGPVRIYISLELDTGSPRGNTWPSKPRGLCASVSERASTISQHSSSARLHIQIRERKPGRSRGSLRCW